VATGGPGHVQLHFAPCDRHLEGNLDLRAQVCATSDRGTAAPRARAGASRPGKPAQDVAQVLGCLSAETVAEELGEHVLGRKRPAAGVKSAARPGGPASGATAGKGVERTAVAVIHLPFFRVVEHLEGLLNLLKLALGVLVVRIQVGVVLARKLPIGLLNLGLGGVARHTEYLVVVFFHGTLDRSSPGLDQENASFRQQPGTMGLRQGVYCAILSLAGGS